MAARDFPKYHSTLLRMEAQLFHNAHNLLIDACILHKAKSYPTAFALAVLAFEELGKLHLIDHIGTEACLSPKADRLERLKSLFSRDGVFNHLLKQRWALCETGRVFADIYHNGKLDRLKQDAFYVGYKGGRIRVPDRIGRQTAYDQIRRCVRVMQKTDDLPFVPLFEDSSTESKRLARGYLRSATRALAEIKR